MQIEVFACYNVDKPFRSITTNSLLRFSLIFFCNLIANFAIEISETSPFLFVLKQWNCYLVNVSICTAPRMQLHFIDFVYWYLARVNTAETSNVRLSYHLHTRKTHKDRKLISLWKLFVSVCCGWRWCHAIQTSTSIQFRSLVFDHLSVFIYLQN